MYIFQKPISTLLQGVIHVTAMLALLMICEEVTQHSHVAAGWNTSTVALQVVRGGGKGTQCLGVYLGQTVLGGYKYGDQALHVGGVSRIGTIKYGLESHGTALARTSSNSKLQTRPLVRDGATK
jgi:hypothetical protein